MLVPKSLKAEKRAIGHLSCKELYARRMKLFQMISRAINFQLWLDRLPKTMEGSPWMPESQQRLHAYISRLTQEALGSRISVILTSRNPSGFRLFVASWLYINILLAAASRTYGRSRTLVHVPVAQVIDPWLLSRTLEVAFLPLTHCKSSGFTEVQLSTVTY